MWLCRVVVLLAVLNALFWFLLTQEGVRRRLPVAWQPSPETANAMSPVTAWRKIIGAQVPRPNPLSPAGGAGGAGSAAEAVCAGGLRDAAGAGDTGEAQTVEKVGRECFIKNFAATRNFPTMYGEAMWCCGGNYVCTISYALERMLRDAARNTDEFSAKKTGAR